MTPEPDSPQDAPDQKMQDASTVGQQSDASAPTVKPAATASQKTSSATPRAAAARKPAARKPAARKPAAPQVAAPKTTADTATEQDSNSPETATVESAGSETVMKETVAPEKPVRKPAAKAATARVTPKTTTPRTPAAKKPSQKTPAQKAPGAPTATPTPRASGSTDGESEAVTPKPPAKKRAAPRTPPTSSTARKPAATAKRKPAASAAEPAHDAALAPAKPAVVDDVSVADHADVPASGIPAAPTTGDAESIEITGSDEQVTPSQPREIEIEIELDTGVEGSPASSKNPASSTDPAPSKNPAPRRPGQLSTGTGPGRGKRTPVKRGPLTIAAQVTSGDIAISAPGATGRIDTVVDDSNPSIDPDPTIAQPVIGSDGEIPPLPTLSPEDAALKFETMPQAPEKKSIFDDQEPMRFVWSKRWPFLTLVPASPANTEGPGDSEPAVDFGTSTETSVTTTVGTTPEAVVESLPTPDASAIDAQPTVVETDERSRESEAVAEATAVLDVPVDDSPETIDADDFVADDLGTDEIGADNLGAAEIGADEVGADEVGADAFGADEIEAQHAVIAAALVAAEPAPVTDDDVIDAALVNEILDEIEAEDAAEKAENAAETAETAGTVHRDLSTSPVVLRISGLSRRFGDTVAVDGIDLDVHEGSFYGIVGPNGAGKTTTLSMVTGLLRPDSGAISVHGVDVWADPDTAKRSIGVLPDRLRLFDRLTGAQLLYYSGVLRGLDSATVRSRVKDLAKAFGLEDALNRLVTDYSAGMTKKVALAAAMIHSPRLLVLDEPFESVDPVSAANVIEILQKYVAHGGTVVLSSHGMDLIQRVCDHVAIIVNGQVLASGPVDDVRGEGTLEDRFVELAGGRKAAEGMEWLHSFSD
ncbi:ABC-2 type transport system ATP-binding protein [Mycetocola sp. CAN_C7]|uniref:ABC transporter ATP-binding protein n=1 Tax=Mycetocola sp. CAN_C7 TaxID=2787724 RepID=UPI001A2C1A4B